MAAHWSYSVTSLKLRLFIPIFLQNCRQNSEQKARVLRKLWHHKYFINGCRTRTSWQSTVYMGHYGSLHHCSILNITHHRSSALLVCQRGDWAPFCETTVCQFYILLLSNYLGTHLAKNTDTSLIESKLCPGVCNLICCQAHDWRPYSLLCMYSWHWKNHTCGGTHTHTLTWEAWPWSECSH